jgi:Tol biopolymer transport system component
MAESSPTGSSAPRHAGPTDDRLESWKEIAAYLKRDVTTVRRWEKREGMPVHRHLHDKGGSVYAYRADLDRWAQSRSATDESGAIAPREDDHARDAVANEPPAVAEDRERAHPSKPETRLSASRWTRMGALLGAFAATLMLAIAAWFVLRRPVAIDPLADARFVQLTDFDGIEQAAALSRDGRFVAFQSDRDGPMDVWMTQVGTGAFVNLTRGGAGEIVNASIRELGFSPGGSLVTYWSRRDGGISVWAVPLLGGDPRPYLEGAAEYDWTKDGRTLVFHTPGPGDPMYVREGDRNAQQRHIFSAPAGEHGHFLVWSPDAAFIYFVQGMLPDRLDIWRIRPTGGTPERITNHESMVTHPVFADSRTLLYLATDADGFGPWIHRVDVEERVSRRVGYGADVYSSLAASADGQRLVATRAIPKRTLWRVPLSGSTVDMGAARRIPINSGTASFARFGPDFLLYVSPKGTTDSLWRLRQGTATEIWSAPEARIIGAPAVRRDGRRIAFPVRQGGEKMLYVVNADGSEARIAAAGFDLQGSPAWSPSGESVAMAALVDASPQLLEFHLDDRPPTALVREHSIDPAWSPDGAFVAFTGPDVGTTFPLRLANRDGSPYPPSLTVQLTRGERHVAFMPQGRTLVMMRGEIRHKNVWMVDLDSGAERQVTEFGPEFALRDFDVSFDGRELVLEQVQEQSDLVLIDRTGRQ